MHRKKRVRSSSADAESLEDDAFEAYADDDDEWLPRAFDDDSENEHEVEARPGRRNRGHRDQRPPPIDLGRRARPPRLR